MTYELRSLAVVGVLAMSAAWTTDSLPVRADPPLDYEHQVVDGRQILAYDRSGNGRIVEVFGDLESADHVAVFVPGAGWSIDNFTNMTDSMSPRRASRTLLVEAKRQAPEAHVAAIAWLGYHPPAGNDLDALRSERAIAGAPQLAELTEVLPSGARVTLVCHSYASVICRHALPEAESANLVLAGATGMDVASADEIDSPAQIWAAEAPDDPMRFLPEVRFAGFGHGIAPTSSGFGARTFGTGEIHGHSRYYEPGSESMENIVRIVLGREQEVTGA